MTFKKENNIVIKVEAYSGEHLLLRSLMIALAVCVAAYLYFVGLSIMNVISHREASVESDRLRSSVSRLEEDFFALSNAISPSMGANLGLVTVSDSTFVRRATGLATNQGSY
jgi:uncharacterized membrane protein YjgN (DUF898 family)